MGWKNIVGGVLCYVFLANFAYATPITYVVHGFAAYEELVEITPGLFQIHYNKTNLYGSVIIADDIEVHSSDKTYYSYTVLDFRIESTLDLWDGSTGLLHWESDDSYPSPQDQYPADRTFYLPGFLGWGTSFDFNDADGLNYPNNNMNLWLHLPAQIEVWSDNLFNTDADYVSFTLNASSPVCPVPEPDTLILLAGGLVLLLFMMKTKTHHSTLL